MKNIEELKETLKTKTNKEFRSEISGLIRSKSPLVYLISNEERRVLEFFKLIAQVGSFKVHVWDCYNGMLNIINLEPSKLITGDNNDPSVALDCIIKEALDENSLPENLKSDCRGNIYLLLDFHRFFNNQNCTPEIERRLRTLSRMDSNTVVIMVGPHYESTPALENDVRIIEFPFPNELEIKNILESLTDSLKKEVDPKLKEASKNIIKNEKEIINSVIGLSYNEIASSFAKSIVMFKDIDVKALLKEKKDIIKKTGILEYFDTEYSMDDVGGLGNLVSWLKDRKSLFGDDARKYGISQPKGCLITGIPGTGKSLSAKAAASTYGFPLIRLDFGALFGSYVGDSERQTRQAIRLAERVAPCVLWIDEVEKGLSGYASSGRSDSGVTNRVIGTFLTWMQEKTAPVFLICTANNHEAIPTEFLRAGRFDEIFFVDLPSNSERAEIFQKIIKRKKRSINNFNVGEIVLKSSGYTGAEIEKAVDMSLLRGFSDGKREINTDDILLSFEKFKPLSVIRSHQIDAMRIWAKDKCVLANTVEISHPFNKKIDTEEL